MTEAILWYVMFVFSCTLHEAAHAWAALKGGDQTAYLGGQVSLNPMPHIQREPFGMVLIPLVTILTMGWPIGFASAPYDPEWGWRYPKKAGWMAAAGPAVNFMVVVLVGVLFMIGLKQGFFQIPEVVKTEAIVSSTGSEMAQKLTMMFSMLFTLNLVLGTFNLLPLPPLDGASMLALFMSPAQFRKISTMLRHPQMGLMGMLLAWIIFPKLFGPIFSYSLMLIYQW